MLSEREAIVVWLQIASSFEQEASLFRPVCIALGLGLPAIGGPRGVELS